MQTYHARRGVYGLFIGLTLFVGCANLDTLALKKMIF